MILRPILDKVIIRPERDDGERKTDSGIVLPSTRHEGGTSSGLILAVGPDVKMPGLIKAGRRAYFNPKFCGQEVNIKCGNQVLIMKEEDILGTEAI